MNVGRIILLSALVAVASGCTAMTIEGGGDKTVYSATGTHTSHGSFYGFVWAEPQVTKCADGVGLYRVRYHTNILYSLVTLASLGLYVPQTVEWWCDGQPKEAEDETDYRPGQ